LNCQEALRLLYNIIDNETDDIDIVQVEKHLRICRHCMARYDFERMFKTFVTDKGQDKCETSRLKTAIEARLDGIDANTREEGGASGSPFRWNLVVVASAAALVICLVAAFTLADYYRHKTEFVPFYKAHAAVEDNEVFTGECAELFAYIERCTGISLHPNSDFAKAGFCSASIDTVNGKPFGHLHVRDQNNDIISIFVIHRDAYDLPKKPDTVINGRKMIIHRCRECSMLGWIEGDLVFIAVSSPDYEGPELARFAQAY
jgi:hypothetical protein